MHMHMYVLYIEQGRDGGRENEFLEGKWNDVVWPLFFLMKL